jgi:hypothetical protein
LTDVLEHAAHVWAGKSAVVAQGLIRAIVPPASATGIAGEAQALNGPS